MATLHHQDTKNTKKNEKKNIVRFQEILKVLRVLIRSYGLLYLVFLETWW